MSAASPELRRAPQRRVLALVLPDLLVELAEQRLLGSSPAARSGSKGKAALGVVLVSGSGAERERQREKLGADRDATASEKPVDATAKLSAVNESARRYGVRAGQSITEACALVSSLAVREISLAEVRAALSHIAEVGLGLGATVSVEAPDTVCIDITGSAHLQGGELALGCELANRVRSMGHSVRIAISDGPRLARAFAQWFEPSAGDPEDRGVCVVPSERTASAFSRLPIMALPLPADSVGWFVRLGVLTIAELCALPRASLGSRLGESANGVLELCAGRDPAPLVAFTPERTLIEASTWDEPLTGTEPLLFVLGGLVSRICARLTGRGEAAQSLELTIQHDPAIARFRGEKTEHVLRFKLAAPLHRVEEVRRIVSARLSKARLGAPSVGMQLSVPKLVPAVARQLELSQVLSGSTVGAAADDEIPVLIAELSSELGEGRVGILQVADSHRPEAKSLLGPALAAAPQSSAPKAKRASAVATSAVATSAVATSAVATSAVASDLRSVRLRKAEPSFAEQSGVPTRLLTEPCELRAPLRVGVSVAIDHRLYTIEQLRFEQRLDAVEWWGAAPVARDYVRLWLQGSSGGFEALAYVDRLTGRRYLHAIAD